MIERRTSKQDEPRGVTINFLGEEIIVKGYGPSSEYVQILVRSLEDRLSALNVKYPNVNNRKLMMFLALSMADELMLLKQENMELTQMVERAKRGGVL